MITMFTQIDALHTCILSLHNMTACSNAQRCNRKMCACVILACIDKDVKAAKSNWILDI